MIEARNEITESLNLLKANASIYQNEADTQMKATQKTLLEYLEKEKAKAKDKMININDCLEDGQYEQKLHSLPAEYHESMMDCASLIIGNATKLGQDALDKVNL